MEDLLNIYTDHNELKYWKTIFDNTKVEKEKQNPHNSSIVCGCYLITMTKCKAINSRQFKQCAKKGTKKQRCSFKLFLDCVNDICYNCLTKK